MIQEQIDNDLKQAMLSKDQTKLLALRGLKAAITVVKTAKAGVVFEDEDALNVIRKQIKQRKESADIYKTQNREDLYEVETGEITILEAYLPKQLSAEEITPIIQKIIDESGLKNEENPNKKMGTLMGLSVKALNGQADNKTISEVIKSILG